MSFEPFIIDNLFSPAMFKKIQIIVNALKLEIEIPIDKIFKRRQIQNHPLFVQLHEELKLMACEKFNEQLIPSYSFLAMYGDKGECPLHSDRSQCYRTIDLCIGQNEVWPIYVNSLEEYRGFGPKNELYLELSPRVKETSKRFDLLPNQAICYSGTEHPHWRNPISSQNFCDLVFFHFVPAGFQEPLD